MRMKLNKKAELLSEEARELNKKYIKLQNSIKEEALKDFPSELRALEITKEQLRLDYNKKRFELNDKIQTLKKEKRNITAEAYAKNKELQDLKKSMNDKFDESQRAWMKWHKKQESISKGD